MISFFLFEKFNTFLYTKSQPQFTYFSLLPAPPSPLEPFLAVRTLFFLSGCLVRLIEGLWGLCLVLLDLVLLCLVALGFLTQGVGYSLGCFNMIHKHWDSQAKNPQFPASRNLWVMSAYLPHPTIIARTTVPMVIAFCTVSVSVSIVATSTVPPLQTVKRLYSIVPFPFQMVFFSTKINLFIYCLSTKAFSFPSLEERISNGATQINSGQPTHPGVCQKCYLLGFPDTWSSNIGVKKRSS